MGPLDQIQTLVQCAEQDIQDVARRYARVLKALKIPQQDVYEWLAGLTWPTRLEETSARFPNLSMLINGEELQATVYVAWYFFEEGEPLASQVSVELVIEDSFLRDNWLEKGYKPFVGRVAWLLLQEFLREFADFGVYFTSELGSSKALWTLQGQKDAFWSFDAAIVPLTVLKPFLPIPPPYTTVELASGIYGLADEEQWHVLPWDA